MGLGNYNLTKALSWYTIGSILIKSINFFTLRIFTTLMSTSDYGVFGVYQSYLSISEMVILVGAAHTIKMVRYDKSIDYDKYVSSVIYIPVVCTLLSLMFIQFYFIFSKTLSGLTKGVWNCLFIAAGTTAIANIISGKLILEGKYKVYILYSLINTGVNIGVSLILCYFVFFDRNGYWARIIGSAASSIVSCIFLLCFLEFRKPCIQYIKMGMLMGLPMLAHAVATQILVQSDKIVIGRVDSYSAVGIYTVANSIVLIPNTILSSVEHSWSPWFYQSLSEKKYDELCKKNGRIISWFALGVAAFILIAPEIVRIMADKEYWNAVYILMPLTMACFAELIYLMPLNLELFYKRNKAIWLYTSMVVIFNIAFDIVCVMALGYLAAAYVTFVARMLLFVLHYIRAKAIDPNYILEIRTVFFSLTGILAINAASVIYVDKWQMRLLMFLVIVICGGFMFRNKIKRIDN